MTIGWGGIGTLWGSTALTVYVAEKRYTKEFMDKAEYFTVMVFDVKDSKVLNYMGTKSGRDGDRSATQGDACPDKKAQALGLHTAYTANGTPYYTEAAMVIPSGCMRTSRQASTPCISVRSLMPGRNDERSKSRSKLA